MDLINNTYQPYQKEKSETVYINKHSNHSLNILKELPKTINKQITDISCNQDIFDATKSTYEEALSKSGFNEELKYNCKDVKGKTRNKEQRKRRRKIIWFNPPFSLSAKINIGKMFFKMLKKNFPKSNPFSKIFSKNTIKINYSCTRNMKSIISVHNKQILTPKNKQVGCNCRIKNSCPLNNKCLTSQLIYQANVTNNLDDKYKYYVGLAETTFKERYTNQKSLFSNEKRKNSTELSKYIWSLRENNKIPSIKWKIVKIVYSKATSSFCKLCLTEKLLILNALVDNKCHRSS